MAFPAILLAIAIAAALGPSAINAVIALVRGLHAAHRAHRPRRRCWSCARWNMSRRRARSARGTAGSCWRHILPNSLAPLLVQLTFIFAYAVLAEASLSFLGVGPPPPTPTWGNIIAEGRDYIREAPLDRAVSRACGRDHRARPQPARRRAARRARSAADRCSMRVSALLSVADLRVVFGRRGREHRRGRRLSASTLAPGEVLGIVGESGSGKSVTALSIMRPAAEPAGRIAAAASRFDGRDLLGWPKRAMQRAPRRARSR